jgi:hypothetical protein
MPEDKVIAEFAASIPQIQSAIKFGGDGSARVQLDVFESELAEVVKLAAFGRDVELRVVVSEA